MLKALITERQVMIEPKGVDAFPMPNRLKIMMASNNDWVVPATRGRAPLLRARRERRARRATWPTVKRCTRRSTAASVAAFLDHLLKLDLSGFEIRDVPHTKGLNRQKLVGADSVDAVLARLPAGGGDRRHGRGPSGRRRSRRRLLHAAYLGHAREHGERHPDTDGEMSIKLAKLWKGCAVGKRRLSAGPAPGSGRAATSSTPWRSTAQAFADAMRMTVEEMGLPRRRGGRPWLSAPPVRAPDDPRQAETPPRRRPAPPLSGSCRGVRGPGHTSDRQKPKSVQRVATACPGGPGVSTAPQIKKTTTRILAYGPSLTPDTPQG